ncbi:MAG: hypothetical protein ACI90V_002560 [Bacillariaceae sp.]|jgi:hypothetical protein
MSLADNAEDLDANQLKFYRVVSSEPVSDANTLFDYMSKFLMKDKKKQLSTKFLDEKDQTVLRLSWNDLRKISNSVLNDDHTERNPIPAWVEQKEVVKIDVDDDDDGDDDAKVKVNLDEGEESPQPNSADSADEIDKIFESTDSGRKNDEDKNQKKEMKKIKKEQKKEKKEAKKAKKVKKEAKKKRKSV